MTHSGWPDHLIARLFFGLAWRCAFVLAALFLPASRTAYAITGGILLATALAGLWNHTGLLGKAWRMALAGLLSYMAFSIPGQLLVPAVTAALAVAGLDLWWTLAGPIARAGDNAEPAPVEDPSSRARTARGAPVPPRSTSWAPEAVPVSYMRYPGYEGYDPQPVRQARPTRQRASLYVPPARAPFGRTFGRKLSRGLALAAIAAFGVPLAIAAGPSLRLDLPALSLPILGGNAHPAIIPRHSSSSNIPAVVTPPPPQAVPSAPPSQQTQPQSPPSLQQPQLGQVPQRVCRWLLRRWYAWGPQGLSDQALTILQACAAQQGASSSGDDNQLPDQ